MLSAPRTWTTPLRSLRVGALVLLAGACAGGDGASNAGAGSGAGTGLGSAGLLNADGQAGTQAGTAGAAGATGTNAAGNGVGSAGSGSAADGGAAKAADASQSTPEAVDAGLYTALPTCPATLAELFSKAVIMPPKSNSGVFNPAPIERRQALESAVRALVTGDLATAQTQAQVAAYDLCRSDDEGSEVIVARPSVAGEGHAVLAWRLSPAVPLIVEAPHAWHDADTDIEGLEMFLTLDARALIVSGIYRCSSLVASPCDGYTTACTGVPSRYTESDAAHNDELLFQSAHVALAESFSDDFVVSLHGFGDTGASVSNSTPSAAPAADSLHIRLVDALQAALPGEKITSCQDYPGAPFEKRMCGSENVQARHVNGSADICGQNASTTSNRFVHVEQSRAVRDKRAQVIAAFGEALR